MAPLNVYFQPGDHPGCELLPQMTLPNVTFHPRWCAWMSAFTPECPLSPQIAPWMFSFTSDETLEYPPLSSWMTHLSSHLRWHDIFNPDDPLNVHFCPRWPLELQVKISQEAVDHKLSIGAKKWPKPLVRTSLKVTINSPKGTKSAPNYYLEPVYSVEAVDQ
jgi:hypothetical protein